MSLVLGFVFANINQEQKQLLIKQRTQILDELKMNQDKLDKLTIELAATSTAVTETSATAA